jgi:hypothetical protein
MQSTTSAAIRGLSVIIFLFLLSTALDAQIKIKERVNISPKSAMLNSIPNEGEYIQSFTLDYPAYVTANNPICPDWVVSPVGPCWAISCNGRIVSGDSIYNGSFGTFPAGTVLTFSEFPPGTYPCAEPQYYITKDPNFGFPNNCGGYLSIFKRMRCGDLDFYDNSFSVNSYANLVMISRLDACLPYYIDFSSPISLMYPDSDFIPIQLKDGCGYSQTPTPVVYRVEITQGKGWCGLYDPASGKRGIIIDSLNSPDGWSSFYLESIGGRVNRSRVN